ncbi:hypothetical protein GCM10010990_37440 [Croceicoccus mobilis]|uniref:Uncharacterized protein n=2 Tax=Croceicoccus mobilis TaxID=1703339 RepID=A0A916ZB31_9SPHN|nr:hypothetical protein GCM10010990_37440 [Croceicoccus mobilis]
MQAQLAVATAADQRALTWGGMLVAAATGAIGGGLALIGKSTPDYVLGLLAVGFSFAMMIASWHSLQTVQPGQFCLPGNRPANWLPENWECIGTDGRMVQQARREQAEHLSNQIAENAENASKRAAKMARSFKLAKVTLFVSGAILLAIIAARFFDHGAMLLIEQAFSRCLGRN